MCWRKNLSTMCWHSSRNLNLLLTLFGNDGFKIKKQKLTATSQRTPKAGVS